MSELSHPDSDSDRRTAAVERPDRRRWQIGMRTLFLVLAAIGVWMAYFINRSRSAALLARIAVLAPLAHELIVADAGKIAAVKLEEHWMDDNNWEVYLPAGRYRLCLATRAIGTKELASPVKSVPIEGGRHRVGLELELQKSVWRVAVSLDGVQTLGAEEPQQWKGPSSHSSGPSAVTEQFPVEKPAVLLRLRFLRPRADVAYDPAAPTEGILLWIEADRRIDRPGGPSG